MQSVHQRPVRRVSAAYRLPRYPEDWGLPESDAGFQVAEELRSLMRESLRGLRATLAPVTFDETTPWLKGFLTHEQHDVMEAITGAFGRVRMAIDGNTLVDAWDQSEARRMALYAIVGVACISIGLRRRDAWKIIEAR